MAKKDATITKVLESLHPRSVLEFLDYRTDTIQENEKVLRCFCPIHKEQVFRTLTIDKRTGAFKCSYNPCPGHKQGDLIQLTALTRRIDYEDAMLELVQQFGLSAGDAEASSAVKDRLLQSAVRMLEEGEMGKALDGLKRVLSAEPENVQALEGMTRICEMKDLQDQLATFQAKLANVHLKNGDHQRAAEVFQKYVQVNPSDVESRLRYAECLHRLDRTDEMLEEMKKIAGIFEKRGELEKALEVYRRLASFDPLSMDVHESAARLQVELGRPEEALKYLSNKADEFAGSEHQTEALECRRLIVRMTPKDADARQLFFEAALGTPDLEENVIEQVLATIDDLKGKKAQSEAVTFLERLAEQYPTSVPVVEKLHAAYIAGGREEDAGRLAETLAEAYVARARDLFAAGDLDQAEFYFGRAEQIQPENLEAVRGLLEIARRKNQERAISDLQKRVALILVGQEAYGKAAGILEDYVAVHPEDTDAQVQLAECLHHEGRRDETIRQMGEIAAMHESHGEAEKALDVYRRMDQLQPGTVDLDDVIARLMVQDGRIDDAVSEMMEHAQSLLETGRLDEALKVFQKVIDMDPSRDETRLRLVDTILSNDSVGEEALTQCLEIVEGFSKDTPGAVILQSLEQLRERFPENRQVLEKTYHAYRAQSRDRDADDVAYKLAQSYFESQEYEAALEWVAPLTRREGPLMPDGLALKAEIYKALENPKQAMRSLLDLIALHERAENYAAAIPVYESAAELAPENLELQKNWIRSLLKQGEDDEAITRGERLLPVLTEEPHQKEALETLELLGNQVPTHIDFLVARSTLLESFGRHTESRELMLGTANAFAEENRLSEGVQVLNHLLEMDPHDLAATEKLADLKLAMGLEQEAAEGYRSLADLYEEQGAVDAQLDVLLKIAKIEPENVDLLEQILHVYDELGNVRDAREMRTRIARIHMDVGNYEAARGFVRTALKANPREVELLRMSVDIAQRLDEEEVLRDHAFRLLEIHEEEGLEEGVDEVLSLLARCFPDDPRVLSYRVQKLCAEGHVQEALPAIEALIQSNREDGRPDEAVEFVHDLFADLELPVEAAGFLSTWIDLVLEAGRIEETWDLTEKLCGLVRQQGEADTLPATFERLIEAAPDADRIRQSHVGVLKSEGLTRAAIDALRDWAKRCVDRGDIQAALRRYHEALELSPDDIDLMNAALELQVSQGLHDGCAEQAMRLADVLENAGLVHRAREVLERALRIEPCRSDLRMRLLSLEELLASPEELRDTYEGTLHRYLDSSSHEAARAVMEEAKKIFPLDIGLRRAELQLLDDAARGEEKVGVLADISLIHAELGQFAEARQTVDEIARMGGDAPRLETLRQTIETRAQAVVAGGHFAVAGAARGGGNGTGGTVAAASENLPMALEMLPLMREYTFSEFIVGPRNNFAFATAMAIAKNPGGDYNPLFLYGDVGLGKTHLLHAIANYVRDHNDGVRLLYTSTEEFTNALIEAIQNNTIREFRALHKSPDILLIDDVHFLAQKERAQEEFFQIFNALYQASRQIVLTSDRPPKEISHLERRLRSRFGAGIIVDIQSPDYETRVAILKHEIDREGDLEVSDDVLALVAETIETNVRELKAVLKQVAARIRIGGAQPDEAGVRQIIDSVSGTAG